MARGRKAGTKNSIKPITTSKKNRKDPIIKSERKVNIKNRIKKLSEKIGSNKGQLVIIDNTKGRYILSQRIQIEGKKDKFKSLMSHTNIESLKEIADHLSENLMIAYNSESFEKQKRSKSSKVKGFDIDHTIFKKYGNECFIFLGFGSIFLEKTNFRTKVNSDKIDVWKIFELVQNKKTSIAFEECKRILQTYSTEQINKILKEIVRFGDRDNANSVRLALEMKPTITNITEKGKVISVEVNKEELVKKASEEIIEEEIV